MGAIGPNINGVTTSQSFGSTAERGKACAALRLKLECDLAAVRSAAKEAREFLARQGVPESELLTCELVLVEACNNAILYATEREQKILVHVSCEEDELELQVIDHTKGFDWPGVVELPSPQDEHGRGLFIIQSLMEEVHYLRGSRENRLVMKKRTPREGSRTLPNVSRELSFRSEEIEALLRCASQIGSTQAITGFSQSLLKDLQLITGVDWFVLRLLSSDGSRLIPANTSSQRLKLRPIALPPGTGGQDFTTATLQKRNGVSSRFGNSINSVERQAALWRSDVAFYEQSPLSSDDPLAGCGAKTGLVHPIVMRNSLLGTLALGRNQGNGPFTPSQIEAIRIFSDFLAIQIINSRLQQEHIESRLLGHELEIARKIQESLLPKAFPSLPGFGLAGFSLSARQVGGDFYDVLPVSEDRVLVVVADVMGKGVPAALFAATLRTLIRTTAEWTARPGELLGRVNRLMFHELSGVDMFITASVALLDARRKKLWLANAGHCQVLVVDKMGQTTELNPDGMPLGIMPEAAFEEEGIPLDDFRCALFYTDGVIESRNAQGVFFGEEQLKAWLVRNARQRRSASQISRDLVTQISSFQGAVPPSDDQTFLIICEEVRSPLNDGANENVPAAPNSPATCTTPV